MSARIGVITFPGTLDDVDAARAVMAIGAQYIPLWHADGDLRGVDAVVVPGGFSYGDYLRAGAIASHAPIMRAVIDRARGGLPVLGICNGFQVLCEAGLLPGALLRNAGLRFVCRDQHLVSGGAESVWTSRYATGERILVPVKHAEGRFVADARTLDELEAQRRVIFRYDGNPNGSLHDIAGVCSADGRVAGLMPHPEHAIDDLTGPSTDGLGFFTSVADFLGLEAGAVDAGRVRHGLATSGATR
jgi:phosphoribosylformylglycinamidine synthase